MYVYTVRSVSTKRPPRRRIHIYCSRSVNEPISLSLFFERTKKGDGHFFKKRGARGRRRRNDDATNVTKFFVVCAFLFFSLAPRGTIYTFCSLSETSFLDHAAWGEGTSNLEKLPRKGVEILRLQKIVLWNSLFS